MSAGIRPYRTADRDDVARVCLRTGASGGDATGMYSDDTLLPDLFAWPYLEYAPDLAHVVDDGEHVVGYLIGVADTAAFLEWWAREWAPGLAARHPAPGGPSARTPHAVEALLLEAARKPEWMRIAELDAYPAHLHANLLPEVQGQGFGRRLIDLFREALAARGVTGLYVGVDPRNTGARAFYDRLGFHELPSSTPHLPLLGFERRTA